MKQLFLILLLSVFSIEIYCAEKEIVLITKTGNIYGTMLVPENNPASKVIALIICGSGATDRNGNALQMQNNSIKYLAEDLCQAGIPTVRYDKWAIGKSASSAISEKDLRFQTYVDDVRSWINKLSRDYTRIVVIGHSEGAMLGILASIDNPKVSSLVLLAGVGRPADEVLKTQLSGQPPMVVDVAFPIIDSLKKGKTVDGVPVMLNSLFRASVQPYLISWFAVNPVAEMKKIKVPVLVVQGDKDIQVSMEDAELLHKSGKNSTKIIIPGMNHVFKECNTLDQMVQLPLYNTPSLKNVPQLSSGIIEFINKHKR